MTAIRDTHSWTTRLRVARIRGFTRGFLFQILLFDDYMFTHDYVFTHEGHKKIIY